MAVKLASNSEQDLDKVTLLRPQVPYEAILPPQPNDVTRQLIGRLRVLLQQSLLKPRQDLDKACMFIGDDSNGAAELYAAAFFHGLEAHGRRNMRFFTPKAREVSVDEMWAARLLEAFQTGNHLNARYLIGLRVEPVGHRRLTFIAGGLSRALLGAVDP